MIIYAVRVSEGDNLPFIQEIEVKPWGHNKYKVIDKLKGGILSKTWYVGRVEGNCLKSAQISNCFGKGHFFYTRGDARRKIELHLDKMEQDADEKLEYIASARVHLDYLEYTGG